MKTKIPFASRCLLLCIIVMAVSGTIAWQLVQLQVVDAKKCGNIAKNELIERETLPAMRGLVMDCHEEILTNNLLTAEVVADRLHLREISVVLDGLAYNHAITDPRWEKAKNEDERRRLIANIRSEMLKQVTTSLTPEEKAERARLLDPKDPQAKLSLEYDLAACEKFFEAHDRLVAQVLAPYLANTEKREKEAEEDHTTRFITPEYIVEKIAQPKAEKAIREAKARNEKPEAKIVKKIVIADKLSRDTAEQIRKALKAARVRGITVQETMQRTYVMPEKLCHVLGYVNHENKGMSGVESQFQSYLAGIDGLREYRHGPRGQILSDEDNRYLAPKDGLNLRLTIDMRLQTIVEQELERGLRHFRAPRGCMIVVEPKTGNILAMASRPSFNLNTKKVITPLSDEPVERNTIKKEDGTFDNGDYNFACQARYEPGSTFKVVAVTAAVDANVMGIHSWVSCDPFSVGGGSKPIRDDHANYGSQPVYCVLKKSSNPGAARVALACKWPLYERYLQRYGLDKSIGIDLPSGGGCLVSDGNNIVNFSRISYGYSVSVSPLHMAMVYATIANDGMRMKPRLIDCITSPDGSIYDACMPQEVERVMSKKTAADLRFALESVTESKGQAGRGTAIRAAIPGFRVGGKTGTAKKTKRTGGYYEGLYTVSFAGIFPIDDPKLVVMTVVDEPHPTDCNPGGGTVAAPIFRMAVERMIDVLNIAPSDPAAYEAYREKIKTEGRPANPYQNALIP